MTITTATNPKKAKKESSSSININLSESQLLTNHSVYIHESIHQHI